jgi:plasmid stability protein
VGRKSNFGTAVKKLLDLFNRAELGFIHVDHHFWMINQPASSPQIAASGSFLLGNTGPRSGSYLIGPGCYLQKCIHSSIMNAWNAFLRGDAMAMLTVRNLPDDVHRALRVQAALHGRSTEAEVREILAIAVKPGSRVRLGEALSALGRKVGLTNEDFEVFQQARDKTPAEPLRFE